MSSAPSGERVSRWLIASAAILCVVVLGATVGVIVTYRKPAPRSAAAATPPVTPGTTTSIPFVTPSPSRPARPPVNPLADIDQDQLVQCIRATGAVPGSHASPDLTKLPPGRVVRIAEDADESIRQLHYTHRVPFDFITRKEMDNRVIHQTLSNYKRSQADDDSQILQMLGAIAPGTDLRSVTKQALGGQVAGFYNDTTRKLVVGAKGAQSLSPTEVTTLAHELDHALVDQALGFPTLHDNSSVRADESLARHALLEGDAVLEQTFFQFSYLSVQQQLQTSNDPAAKKADRDLQTVPHYLAAGFLFPYTEGVNFVCSLYLDGGWDAVDQAYFKPPVSTAQIMWPDRYLGHENPVAPRPPRNPAGWAVASRSALGAADLKALFEAPGDDGGRALSDPKKRAGAWAGGRVTLFSMGDQHALAIDLVQRASGRSLCRSLREWYRAAFPNDVVRARSKSALVLDGNRDADIECSGHNVRVGIGPTAAVASAFAR